MEIHQSTNLCEVYLAESVANMAADNLCPKESDSTGEKKAAGEEVGNIG